jgi:hypothetical protein
MWYKGTASSKLRYCNNKKLLFVLFLTNDFSSSFVIRY